MITDGKLKSLIVIVTNGVLASLSTGKALAQLMCPLTPVS